MKFKEMREIKEIINEEEKKLKNIEYIKQFVSKPTEEDYDKLVHKRDIFDGNDYNCDEIDEDSKKLR